MLLLYIVQTEVQLIFHWGGRIEWAAENPFMEIVLNITQVLLCNY